MAPRLPAELVLEVQGGARMVVPGDLRQTTTYVLLEQEDWFEEEIRFVRKWLGAGMHALDVGANLGIYTVAMANAVGDSGRVWSFEPGPATVAMLRRTVQANGMRQVSIREAAVSDRAGTIGLLVDERSEESSVARQPGRGVVEVAAVALDGLARELKWESLDFIKIDVEGHEAAVLHGAEQLLRAQSPVVMFEIKREGRIDLGAAEALASLGYGIYRLLPGPLVLEPFDPDSPDPSILNLFACKPDRARGLATAGFLVDSPQEAPRIPAAVWTDYAASAPYSAQAAAGWAQGKSKVPGAQAYLQGLAAYTASRDRARSAAERHALIFRAQELVREALDFRETPARRITLARLIDETGERSPAVELMTLTRDQLESAPEEALAEPLLAPSERFEQLAPGANGQAWLRCAVIEQLEKRRRYSSMFTADTTRALLEPIAANPFRSAEAERRWQLVGMLRGLQQAPQPSPLLCARTAENLNPKFWCP